uniref:J domain-containing protein n=1 Tax=Davidia involucrata TaxID=16924 RepID=A0A5B7C1G2_DAVIN
MSNGIISGSEARFNLCTKPNLSTRKSLPEPCPNLLFNTHHIKPSTSIRTKSAAGSYSYRSRTKAAINSLYGTAQATESFYQLLGISESGTVSEIKQAYKQLARKYHPDVSPPERTEEYTERFIRVQEAYETLSDPQTRALYDSDLSKGFHLAFSARRRSQYDQRFEEWGEWRDRWESQLMELRRRNENKNSRRQMSWGARMRRQKSEAF